MSLVDFKGFPEHRALSVTVVHLPTFAFLKDPPNPPKKSETGAPRVRWHANLCSLILANLPVHLFGSVLYSLKDLKTVTQIGSCQHIFWLFQTCDRIASLTANQQGG